MPVYTRKAKLDPHHQQISWYLTQHGIYNLYHFTSVTNLKGIFRHGRIYSRDQLQMRHIAKNVEFGDASLSHGGIGDQRVEAYVSLGYFPGLPMAYLLEKKRHLCYLVFSHDVARTSGVLFSDRNAASWHADKERGLSGLENVDFEAVHAKKIRRHTDDHIYHQAEVLIPDALPTSAVEYAAFRSQSSLEEAQRLCDGIDSLPPFRVEPKFFHLYGYGRNTTYGVINARLVNRHPFRNSPMKLMSEDELRRLLSAPNVEGHTVDAQGGVCLVQTVQMPDTLPLAVKWWHESFRKPVKEATPLRRAKSSMSSFHHVAATLGPNDLQSGKWRVESWLTLDGCEVKQLEIRFEVE